MKKIIVINIFTIFLGFLFFLNLDNLLAHSWDLAPVFFLLPVFSGAFVALIQNEDRSYKYFPKIFVSSFVFSFVTIFLMKLFVYFGDNVDTPLFKYFNPFKDRDEIVGHFGLAGIYFLGGLIGVVARGINIIFLPERKFNIDLNISFFKSFFIGAIILLGANIYYIFVRILPDDRWKFEIPVTSIFICFYLLLFFGIWKKVIKSSRYNYIIWIYNFILSLVFLSNAEAIQIHFQEHRWHYLQHISTLPYVIIFSLGIICFIPLVLFLQMQKDKRV